MFSILGMRSLGRAERILDRMLVEATKADRKPFGKIKAEFGGTQTMIAEARMVGSVRLRVFTSQC
jgi:hypothetical protein